MGKALDKLITMVAERDWCGCPIVMGITAHVCGIVGDVHDEAACARQHGDCPCGPYPSVEPEADEEPYEVRTDPRAPRGFWASKGLDQEFVIIGEAGMYVGTIVDVCADLEAGHYAGDTLVTEVWRKIDNGPMEKVIMDSGWPVPGMVKYWPDAVGQVRVGLYTRTLDDASEVERQLAVDSPGGLRCLAWARFEIDGAA